MKLSQWNRFRNGTYKERRADEPPFIPRLAAPATAAPEVAAPTDKMKGPAIKRVFSLSLSFSLSFSRMVLIRASEYPVEGP